MFGKVFANKFWPMMGLIALFMISSPAIAGTSKKQSLDEMVRVMRCTNQWDLMVYSYGMRMKGISEKDAHTQLVGQWDNPKDKKFSKLINGSITDAVDYTYSSKSSPRMFSQLLMGVEKGFNRCVTDKKLRRYKVELKIAASNAGLVTLWDYYKRRGIPKERIIEKSRKLSVDSRKMLDAVYQDKFNVHMYRVRNIWNPVADQISSKYHGVEIKRK